MFKIIYSFMFLVSKQLYTESITNAAEEGLMDSLNFKFPGSGQYIQERRSVSF
jgi:hypothetical protein